MCPTPLTFDTELCASSLLPVRMQHMWATLVLRLLAHDALSLNALHGELPGVGPKELTRALRTSERDRFVTPPREEKTGCGLTPLGQNLLPLVLEVSSWIAEHWDEIVDAGKPATAAALEVHGHAGVGTPLPPTGGPAPLRVDSRAPSVVAMNIAANSSTPALEVRDLVRTYGDGANAVEALAGVDLTFAPRTFTAIMGPSGSGKSTFLNCAAGLERPTGGRVLVDGRDITDLDEDDRTRLRREQIGFVFQHFHLMSYLTAEQNVGLPLRLAGRRHDRERIRGLLAQVGLGDRSRHLPDALSGGQQQRVAIARALVADPAVLLADEPTGALDSTTAHEVLELLRTSVDTLGQTVVMVTHDPVAASYADAAIFLVDGRVAGRMDQPTAAAVASQMAHLDDLVLTGGES